MLFFLVWKWGLQGTTHNSTKKELQWTAEDIKKTLLHKQATGRDKGECSLHIYDCTVLSDPIACDP